TALSSLPLPHLALISPPPSFPGTVVILFPHSLADSPTPALFFFSFSLLPLSPRAPSLFALSQPHRLPPSDQLSLICKDDPYIHPPLHSLWKSCADRSGDAARHTPGDAYQWLYKGTYIYTSYLIEIVRYLLTLRWGYTGGDTTP